MRRMEGILYAEAVTRNRSMKPVDVRGCEILAHHKCLIEIAGENVLAVLCAMTAG